MGSSNLSLPVGVGMILVLSRCTLSACRLTTTPAEHVLLESAPPVETPALVVAAASILSVFGLFTSTQQPQREDRHGEEALPGRPSPIATETTISAGVGPELKLETNQQSSVRCGCFGGRKGFVRLPGS